MMEPFPCDQCGACCKQVNLSEATSALDRGDGICKHLNTKTNLCTVYHDRPDICRIDSQYHLHYASQYSWDIFVKLNLDACEALKAKLE